jgi:hypothetical protein
MAKIQQADSAGLRASDRNGHIGPSRQGCDKEVEGIAARSVGIHLWFFQLKPRHEVRARTIAGTVFSATNPTTFPTSQVEGLR